MFMLPTRASRRPFLAFSRVSVNSFGEVTIEEGEKEILHVVIGSPIALQEICDVGATLAAGKVHLREVVRDYDEESDQAAQRARTEKFGVAVAQLKALGQQVEALRDQLDGTVAPPADGAAPSPVPAAAVKAAGTAPPASVDAADGAASSPTSPPTKPKWSAP